MKIIIILLLSTIYFIFCNINCNDEIQVEDSKNCFNRSLTDEENNYCCYIKLSRLSDTVFSGCYEYSKNINITSIKQNLIIKYSETNITLDNFTCPTNGNNNNFKDNTSQSDNPKDFSLKNILCYENTPIGDINECFNRSLIDKKNNYCCYIKISGLFGNFSGCSEFPTIFSLDYIKQVLISQYADTNLTLYDFSCPINRKDNIYEGSTCNDYTLAVDSNECFSKPLADEENNYCCYLKLSGPYGNFNGCNEFQKEINIDDIKKTLINQYLPFGYTIDLSCPKTSESFYIKSWFILIVIFLI